MTNMRINKLAGNIFVLMSSIAWMITLSSSMYMFFCEAGMWLQYFSMVFSVIAPLISVASLILEVREQYLKSKLSDPNASILKDPTFWLGIFFVSCGIADCVFHLIEGLVLSGRLQDAFNFDNVYFVAARLVISMICVIGAFAIDLQENKKDKSVARGSEGAKLNSDVDRSSDSSSINKIDETFGKVSPITLYDSSNTTPCFRGVPRGQ